jgi:hypothetical protein
MEGGCNLHLVCDSLVPSLSLSLSLSLAGATYCSGIALPCLPLHACPSLVFLSPCVADTC